MRDYHDAAAIERELKPSELESLPDLVRRARGRFGLSYDGIRRRWGSRVSAASNRAEVAGVVDRRATRHTE